MQNKTVEQLAEDYSKEKGSVSETKQQVKYNAFISGWKSKKGLEWVEVKSLSDYPANEDKVIIKLLFDNGETHYKEVHVKQIWHWPNSCYRYKVFILSQWIDEQPNPDEPKQTAIAFAEYTREAPGNMWQRAHGPLLSTEELYEEFIEYLKNKK